MFALRVSPALANRIVDAAKGVLLQFLPDVYLSVDHLKGQQSGKSPGNDRNRGNEYFTLLYKIFNFQS